MPSKDQRSIDEPSSYEKWDRAKSLFLESLHKPDHDLRGCAHNQGCYDELMEIREHVLKYLLTLKEVQNYHQPDESDLLEQEKLSHTKSQANERPS
jgi:hypothetical protein